ncbi:hypothetical protein AAIR98_001442 [Elusimicrobium simillimum]|uniref:PBSX family phage terminase large subunit n=1 Tax=Elusimicrobium simillimum TaxID=3143438 RepID=UPI003C6EB615
MTFADINEALKNVVVVEKFKPFFVRGQYRVKVAHGGRGGAKSHNIARALLILSCQKKMRILCAREQQNSIAESVHQLFSQIIKDAEIDGFFDITENTIRVFNGSEFVFKGFKGDISKIKSLEGFDICWVEEAHNISKDTIDILMPTIRKGGSEVWFTFNRFEEKDPVWMYFCEHPDDTTLVLEVQWYDNPFFTDALNIERLRCLNERPQDYDHIWLGKPRNSSGPNAFFPRELVTAACQRNINDYDVRHAAVVLGLDPNGGGDDRAVIARRQGLKLYPLLEFKDLDPLGLANRMAIEMRDKNADGAFTDAAFGEAVVAICSGQLHFNITPVHFASSPLKDIYRNKRAEMYGEALEWLRAGGCLPDDADLREELAAIEIDPRKSEAGKICLISKEEIRQKIGRSPDKADAFVLTFAMPVQSRAQTEVLGGFGMRRTVNKLKDYD